MRMKIAITMLAATAVALSATAFVVSADGEKTEKTEQDARRGRGKRQGRDRSNQDGAASRDSKFRAWDKDGDGFISRSEYPGHPGNFRALDTDNDGRLTIDEFQHHAGAAAPREGASVPDATPAERDEDFDRLDVDNDGAIARDEWRGRRSSFEALDGDRNGVVSRDEYRRGSTRGRSFRK